jgi:hypothetical protein
MVATVTVPPSVSFPLLTSDDEAGPTVLLFAPKAEVRKTFIVSEIAPSQDGRVKVTGMVYDERVWANTPFDPAWTW